MKLIRIRRNMPFPFIAYILALVSPQSLPVFGLGLQRFAAAPAADLGVLTDSKWSTLVLVCPNSDTSGRIQPQPRVLN